MDINDKVYDEAHTHPYEGCRMVFLKDWEDLKQGDVVEFEGDQYSIEYVEKMSLLTNPPQPNDMILVIKLSAASVTDST